MPTLDPLHPLQSSVLEVLAEKPCISVQELHECLKKVSSKVSVQNLYRTVAQMTEAQLLVKEKGKVSLNAVWMTSLARLAERMQRHYGEAPDLSDLPVKENDRREFTAESLLALDPLWNDMIMRVTKIVRPSVVYEYASHPYYFVGKLDTELRLYHSIGDTGAKCCTLHGNDTVLDRYGNKLGLLEGMRAVTGGDHPFPREGYFLMLCGDYILEVVMPPVLANHFAFFYRTVQSMSEFEPELYNQAFRMKTRCKLTVRKSAADAAMLRAKLLPFF